MGKELAIKLLVATLIVIGLFWETLSILGTYGEFSDSHYKANSERFFLIAPMLILVWLGRKFLPRNIQQKFEGEPR